MIDFDYDLIIIGSGPSGRTAAIQAAKLKRRVLVIDRKDRLGGVSVHTGTIPSKTLRETVLNLVRLARAVSFYGRSYRVKDQIKAEDLKARLHMTLDYEVDVLEHQFNRNHVETLAGMAQNSLAPMRSRSRHEAGDTTRVTGEKFLIATGTRTYRPDTMCPSTAKPLSMGMSSSRWTKSRARWLWWELASLASNTRRCLPRSTCVSP